MDFGLGDYKLWYVRDREQRKVDALITCDNLPWFLVEVKRDQGIVAKPAVEKWLSKAKAFPILNSRIAAKLTASV